MTKLQKVLSGPTEPEIPPCEFCLGSGTIHGATCLRCLGTGLTVDHEDEEGYFDAVDLEAAKNNDDDECSCGISLPGDGDFPDYDDPSGDSDLPNDDEDGVPF